MKNDLLKIFGIFTIIVLMFFFFIGCDKNKDIIESEKNGNKNGNEIEIEDETFVRIIIRNNASGRTIMGYQSTTVNSYGNPIFYPGPDNRPFAQLILSYGNTSGQLGPFPVGKTASDYNFSFTISVNVGIANTTYVYRNRSKPPSIIRLVFDGSNVILE